MAHAQQSRSNRITTLRGVTAFLFGTMQWFAVLLSIPVFVIGCFDATHLTHQIRPDEQEHIELVSRFAKTFIGQYKRLPDYDEYQTWVKAADEQQGTHLGGNGYALSTECAKERDEFCVGFLAGELWVTYRSGQPAEPAEPAEPAQAAIDGRLRDAWLEASAFAALIALAVFFRRAAHSARNSRQAE